ncbi:MAG: thioesterase family protein [Pseudomonadales bacterium]|nr:thioesterase family protein [Pseudomonadales bacterium]
MKQVFRGSVNRWECDENDHLNVRFYAHKMYQTLQAGLVESGLVSADKVHVTRRIRSMHMRYITEARIAAPLTGFFGVVHKSENDLTAVTELRHTSTNDLMASYVFELRLPVVPDVETIPMPEGAGSRGLPAECSTFASLSLQEALDSGFRISGQGVVQAEECDPSGYLLFYQYVGRVSDAVPNLWAGLGEASERGGGMLGGAVLEYRTDKPGSLKLDDVFTLVSGFTGLGDKTKYLAHLLFENTSGACIAASEAVAVNMDLVARKAISMPDKDRDILQAMIVDRPRR